MCLSDCGGHERFGSKEQPLVCDLLRSSGSSGQCTCGQKVDAVGALLISVDGTLTSTPLQPQRLSYFSYGIRHCSGYCLLFYDILIDAQGQHTRCALQKGAHDFVG